MSTTQTDHPRLPVSERVPLAAAFALLHAADGFTNRMLAEALNCSEEVARYTRLELQRQLARSPIRLSDMARAGGPPRTGWAQDADDHHHDRHLYRLTVREASKDLPS